MTDDASVMVMWYSSFGIQHCYSCITVDLNCWHRINQEVKVWRFGFSLNMNQNTVFWQPMMPLLISYPYIPNWCCNAQMLNVCCPLLCRTAVALIKYIDKWIKVCGIWYTYQWFQLGYMHFYLPKTYTYAMPCLTFLSRHAGNVNKTVFWLQLENDTFNV